MYFISLKALKEEDLVASKLLNLLLQLQENSENFGPGDSRLVHFNDKNKE